MVGRFSGSWAVMEGVNYCSYLVILLYIFAASSVQLNSRPVMLETRILVLRLRLSHHFVDGVLSPATREYGAISFVLLCTGKELH
jgi:hypothetical protein